MARKETPRTKAVKAIPAAPPARPARPARPAGSATVAAAKPARKQKTPKAPTAKAATKAKTPVPSRLRGDVAQPTALRTANWPKGDEAESLVRIRKAGEVVAERIRMQIAKGVLPIGHQLPREEELTAMFGIARTTLREALRVLESQGLLEIKRGRGGGGIVTMPHLDHLAQSFALALQLRHTTLGDIDEARMMIEPPLAGRLAAKHSDEDLEILGALVAQAHDAAEASDRDKFGAAAAALHETIIERGGNNTMAVMGALLHDLLDRHLRTAAVQSTQDQMRRAVRSYRKLLEIIERGDASAASAHWHRQLVFLHQHRSNVQLLDVYED